MFLDVSISGIHVEALILAMAVNALFYGALAMAIGAWTGSRGLASGVTAGIMVLSFVAVGLLPLIESLDFLAKAFPWYYFSGSDPHLNGVNWGHIAVLITGIAAFATAAVIGFNRRDLKGQTVGVTMTDRLRANPMTRQVAERLAGSGTGLPHLDQDHLRVPGIVVHHRGAHVPGHGRDDRPDLQPPRQGAP